MSSSSVISSLRLAQPCWRSSRFKSSRELLQVEAFNHRSSPSKDSLSLSDCRDCITLCPILFFTAPPPPNPLSSPPLLPPSSPVVSLNEPAGRWRHEETAGVGSGLQVPHVPLRARRLLREADAQVTAAPGNSTETRTGGSGGVGGGDAPGSHGSSSSEGGEQFSSLYPIAALVNTGWEMLTGHKRADARATSRSSSSIDDKHLDPLTPKTNASSSSSSSSNNSSGGSSSSSSNSSSNYSSSGGSSSNNSNNSSGSSSSSNSITSTSSSSSSSSSNAAVIGLGVALAVVGVVAASASILVCLMCWGAPERGGPTFMRLTPRAFGEQQQLACPLVFVWKAPDSRCLSIDAMRYDHCICVHFHACTQQV